MPLGGGTLGGGTPGGGTQDGTAPVRVLLVDDHPIVHQGVERLLEDAPDLALCPAARSVRDAVRIARTTPPDVVLLDLHLPGSSAPEAAAALRAAAPAGLRILLFTGDTSRSVAQVAGLIGADGVVHKDSAPATLTTAIREVARGHPFHEAAPAERERVVLSHREYQVLRLLAMGESNPQIARQLGLAPNTVKSYVQSLLHRLGARNRLEAVVKAQQAGML